jgi:hypothetical protein
MELGLIPELYQLKTTTTCQQRLARLVKVGNCYRFHQGSSLSSSYCSPMFKGSISIKNKSPKIQQLANGGLPGHSATCQGQVAGSVIPGNCYHVHQGSNKSPKIQQFANGGFPGHSATYQGQIAGSVIPGNCYHVHQGSNLSNSYS